MKTNTDKSFDRQPGSIQATPVRAQALKLGLDVHVDRYVVVRQLDGNTPQPAQTFTPAAFLAWVKTQLPLAERVYACYEAGPFGYGLNRQLESFGLTNYVVRPRLWDVYGKKVKTDQRDAKAMVLSLDRYIAGNREAFCVVRVPPKPRSKRGAARVSGSACSRRNNAWRLRDAATPCITGSTWRVPGGPKGSGKSWCCRPL
jgi:hypothetical protein